jgi:carbon monoxide dehydrogenase subunit G
MFHLEGVQTFPQPAAEVAAKLSDAGFLARCIPDAQVSEAAADRSVGKIRPKLSFLTGSITLTAEVVAREPGRSVTFRLLSQVIGASSTVVTKMDFTAADGGGTAVAWVADLTAMTGLMKMVPQGLLEGSAKKVTEEVWAAVSARLGDTGV